MKPNFLKSLLTIACLLCSIGVYAHDFVVDGIYYNELSSTEIEVSYKGYAYNDFINEYTGAVVIPASITYDGTTYNVTSIGDGAFYDCSGLTEVTIPNSVTSIGNYAFYKCTGLTEVTIGNSVTSIGDYAFKSCTGLKSLTIEDGDATLKMGYNYYSSSYKIAGEGLFYDCPIETLYIGRNLSYRSDSYYGYSPFYYIEELKTVTIGNSVTSIGDRAFYGCTGLTEVYITDLSAWCGIDFGGITANPLSYAHNLYINNELVTSLVIPDDVTSIGAYAFYECTGLTDVTIPNSVTSIGNYAFYDCTRLTVIHCHATTPPTINRSTFSNYSATLCVPWQSVSAYKSAEYWANFTSINKYLVDGLYYTIISSTDVEVTYMDNNYSGTITIPETIEIEGITYNVTSIGSYAFKWCYDLTEVTIPNSVTSIGESAFRGCTGLTEVTIPDGVTSIGDQAFYDCTGLTEITIPNSVASIGDYAFYDCTGLTSIVVDKDNPTYDSRDNCNAIIGTATNTLIVGCKNSIIPNSVTSIGECAFYDCTGLTEITISNSVTSIGYAAFAYCSNLNEVIIGSSVIEIGERAFRGCTGLKSLTIEDGDATLKMGYNSHSDSYNIAGEGLFYDCPIETLYIGRNLSYSSGSNYGYSPFYNIEDLKTVTIGNSVTSIDNYAFKGCTGLKSLTIEDGDATLKMGYNYFSSSSEGEGLFYDCPIETLYIGRNLSYSTGSYYGYSPFAMIKELKTVTIGNSVTSIGYQAFDGCSGLTEITISNSVTSIGNYAFYLCTGLTEITIPNSVTSIGNYAFYKCTGLTEVTIGNSVTLIGLYAFYECTGLTEVTIPNSVTSIGDYAFFGCSGLTTLNFNAENCTTMGSSNYPVFNGCSNLTAVNIGESVKTIPAYAFYGCTSLSEIAIPNSVTSIGNYAFYDCTGLTTIYCHATTPPTISSDSFSDYSATLYVPVESMDAYKTADYWKKFRYINKYFVDGLYYNILSTTDVEVTYKDNNYNSYSGAITIPETIEIEGITYNVTSIGDHAFYKCTYLTEVTIPNSVISIGNYAFYDCTGLIEIHCHATTPPTISGKTFSDYSATLYVPIESAVAYRTAIYWEYFNINKYFVDGLYYNILSTTDVEVTYKDDNYNSYSGTINIPETIEVEGIIYNVTSIGKDAFRECTGLTEITIPNSVASIGDDAFSGCTGLTGVYITDISAWCGIDFGYYYANPLYYAHNLYINNELVTSLVIPEDVTSIGYATFAECTSLTKVTIPNSVTSIGDYAFAYCTGLTEVTFGSSVTSIGSSAFSGCTGLTVVTIPNSVTSIGDYAFAYCTDLTEVTISNSVTSIGNSAFYECTELTEVTIPNSVTSIGNTAFSNCTGLTEVTIPNSVTSIGGGAFFGCTGLTEVTIGNSVTLIGLYAFYECTGLTEVTIPNSVTSIGDYAFFGCSGLTTLNFNAENSTTMGSSNYPVFNGCSNLTAVNIGESVKTIPAYAFYGCTSLSEIAIPNSVTSIGNYAFYDCTGLTEITIPNSITSIGYATFAECTGLTKVTIPNSVTSIGESAFQSCTGLKEIAIPNSVTSIGYAAFYGCTGLTEITIPNSVTSIGYGAFAYCSSLNEVIIGSSVIEIGEYAFYDCTGLKTLISEAIVPPTIEYNTFEKANADIYISYRSSDAYKATSWGNLNLNFITKIIDDVCYVATNIADREAGIIGVADKGVCTVVLPDSILQDSILHDTFRVTSIEADAFKDCIDLDEIVVSNSVEYIGDSAFEGCTGLRTVTIGSGVNEIGENTFAGCDRIKTVNCYAEVPSTIYSNTFTVYTNDNATLHVVKGCKDTYADAKYWKYFLNITDDLISADFIVSESIVLDQTNITATAGETVVLTATIYPEDATEKAVVWSVSDATIATIEPIDNVSAKITVLREGVATITATTIDGSNLSATCTIDVYSDIEALLRDSENVEYYDLNGFRVENPTRGIYIVKCGDIVHKVFVNKTR